MKIFKEILQNLKKVESGGLVYTYRRFGTEESLTIKYGNIEAVMNHLTPLLREDGVAVDVWGTYVGTDRPLAGFEPIISSDLDPVLNPLD